MLRSSTNGGWKQQGVVMLDSHSSAARVVAAAVFAVLMLSPNKPVRAAAPNADAPSVTLRFLSTDLGTPQGVSILYRRIREAASSVCGPYDSALLEEKALRDKCVEAAIATAVSSVHNERLSTHHWHRIHGKRQWSEEPTSLAVR